MGMTDKQFEAYQQSVLRRLQAAREEITEKKETKTLDTMIEDIENQLKKP